MLLSPSPSLSSSSSVLFTVSQVWTREEMEQIARIAKKHNLIVLSDEVYERMTYDDEEHIRMASLPDMWERTITLGIRHPH